MYEHKVYLIETLTNTHVGSGDTSFGVVDNLIQKDTVTSLPVFHSSSIKGSFKEHFEQYKNNGIPQADFELIFGTEDKPGTVRFYDARLLTLPLRASKRVFYYCTSPATVSDYLDSIKTFCKIDEVKKLEAFFSEVSIDKDFVVFDTEEDLAIEDYSEYSVCSVDGDTADLIKKYFCADPKNFALFRNEIFTDICSGSLPVIARNKIGKDGTSENLFYEEVLPRRSWLWFMLGFEKDKTINGKFEEKLTKDLFQTGGNASIGYGVVKIHRVGGQQ